jgi:hypothetical protein
MLGLHLVLVTLNTLFSVLSVVVLYLPTYLPANQPTTTSYLPCEVELSELQRLVARGVPCHHAMSASWPCKIGATSSHSLSPPTDCLV